jgi:hypothetical protein
MDVSQIIDFLKKTHLNQKKIVLNNESVDFPANLSSQITKSSTTMISRITSLTESSTTMISRITSLTESSIFEPVQKDSHETIGNEDLSINQLLYKHLDFFLIIIFAVILLTAAISITLVFISIKGRIFPKKQSGHDDNNSLSCNHGSINGIDARGFSEYRLLHITTVNSDQLIFTKTLE